MFQTPGTIHNANNYFLHQDCTINIGGICSTPIFLHSMLNMAKTVSNMEYAYYSC